MPVEISDTNFSFRFRVASVAKPIVSAEGLFHDWVYLCDLQDRRLFGHHSQWSDNHVASATENVLAARENQHKWRVGKC